MTEHTPTPWRIHGAYPAEIYATVDENRFMVADVLGAGSQDQDAINAAFIVKAVNSHDDLVKALDWAMKRVIRKAPHFAYEGDGELYAFAHAHSLLAKLEVIPDPVGGSPKP